MCSLNTCHKFCTAGDLMDSSAWLDWNDDMLDVVQDAFGHLQDENGRQKSSGRHGLPPTSGSFFWSSNCTVLKGRETGIRESGVRTGHLGESEVSIIVNV